MSAAHWAEGDLQQLQARGLTPDEAQHQLDRAVRGRLATRIERACTVGDAILRPSQEEEQDAVAAWREVSAAGRVSFLIPASGAASRMFRELLAARERPELLDPAGLEAAREREDGDALALAAFLGGLPRFAFHDALAAEVAKRGATLDTSKARGPFDPILDALLGPDGLGYAEAPKGVLAFHRAPGGARTPLEEHLRDAARVAADTGGRARVHLTISPAHRDRFEALVRELRARLEPELGVRFEVGFSFQELATDTIAAMPTGAPFRDEDGALLFRPAGHGALLGNLERSGGDLVFLKNVDNVAAGGLREPGVRSMRLLIGLLARLESRVRDHLTRLRERPSDATAAEALAFARTDLGLDVRDDGDPVAAVRLALDRPLRVCGMVPNTGEPGGGPFWVRGEDGRRSCQIVEGAQVDASDAEQNARYASSTHFNPTFLACALRDLDGKPHRLDRFVDPDAWMISRKSAGGRELIALERPGLWNGSMAGWITRFVEVPIEVFNPVKTVLDLLRPAHQPED